MKLRYRIDELANNTIKLTVILRLDKNDQLRSDEELQVKASKKLTLITGLKDLDIVKFSRPNQPGTKIAKIVWSEWVFKLEPGVSELPLEWVEDMLNLAPDLPNKQGVKRS